MSSRTPGALKFSAGFYQVLGIGGWQLRPAFGVQSSELHPMTIEPACAMSEQTPVVLQDALPAPAVVQLASPVVLIGYGLHAFWQDEQALEWRLWVNIMQAFGWQEEQVVFVDSALLMSDDQVFASVEEVIGMGIERLLSMDEGHPINETLSEGVEILTVPNFEALLGDPYAKKSFYQQALKLFG
ncbi:hypothetical protein [Thiosulfatimonas sediminis]|uniref:hypothetical protein n=1 Tax=Thiosulfatimonas sediminis TaxID=2675054 RepID=UPI00156377C1|nr:hypothetical protein [Thiosulfatimonas sediminis]